MGDIRDDEVVAAMERFGGSFVRALAVAAGHADVDNLKRIKAAFPEYWNRYTELAMEARRMQ